MCDTEVTCPSGRSHVHVPCGGFAHLPTAGGNISSALTSPLDAADINLQDARTPTAGFAGGGEGFDTAGSP